MPKAPRIHKKLSDKHVVWFGESNQWVGFEVPAYKVYKWHESGKSKKKIAKKIASKYGLEEKEAKRFVSEIITELERIKVKDLYRPLEDIGNKVNYDISGKNQNASQKISHVYLINSEAIEVEYLHERLAYYLHPPISHLETTMKEVNSTKLTISRHENGFSISRDGTQQSYFSNIAELKHAFINQIMFATYSVPPEDWFAWIHGSAVAKGQNATIFTSSSGSGKSTMAALMQSRGYRFVSDDMVYLRQSDRLAYPVPTAMSLKEGSVSVVSNYIPSLKTDKLHFYEFGDRKVCFKKPDCEGSETFNPVVVRTLIFIKYKQGTIFSMKKLSDFEAFQRFHKQAWVNGSKESALAFITWFEELSYYELEYSDTDKAIMEIEKLFQENS